MCSNSFFFCFFVEKTLAAEKASAKVKWTVNPFAQKVFVENKGQYQSELNNQVLYQVEDNGAKILFTSKGLLYKHIKVEKKDKEFSKKENAEETPQKVSNLIHMHGSLILSR